MKFKVGDLITFQHHNLPENGKGIVIGIKETDYFPYIVDIYGVGKEAICLEEELTIRIPSKLEKALK